MADSAGAARPPDFQAWSREVATRIEAALGNLLPQSRIAPARLHDAMRYSTLGGGKRIRSASRLPQRRWR